MRSNRGSPGVLTNFPSQWQNIGESHLEGRKSDLGSECWRFAPGHRLHCVWVEVRQGSMTGSEPAFHGGRHTLCLFHKEGRVGRGLGQTQIPPSKASLLRLSPSNQSPHPEVSVAPKNSLSYEFTMDQSLQETPSLNLLQLETKPSPHEALGEHFISTP